MNKILKISTILALSICILSCDNKDPTTSKEREYYSKHKDPDDPHTNDCTAFIMPGGTAFISCPLYLKQRKDLGNKQNRKP